MNSVLATGKPVVVVLVSGRPYAIEQAVVNAGAILATWLPGEGGGEAVARTLVGLNNPGGKSPLSFPKTAGAMPYTYNYTKKAGGLPRQKQFGANFPFGHGLSYTSFAWDDFTLKNPLVGIMGSLNSPDCQEHRLLAGMKCAVYVQDTVGFHCPSGEGAEAFARLHSNRGRRKGDLHPAY